MGNLFGRKKESRVTEQDKAVLVSLSQAIRSSLLVSKYAN